MMDSQTLEKDTLKKLSCCRTHSDNSEIMEERQRSLSIDVYTRVSHLKTTGERFIARLLFSNVVFKYAKLI